MLGVVFVAPFLMPNTVRFVTAVARTPGIRLGLVTQDPVSKLPPAVAGLVQAGERIENCFDPRQLADATRKLGDRLGGVDRLLGALEQLQVPLAEARELVGLAGMDAETARNFRDKSRMKTVLRDAGIPCARHCLAASPEQAREFVREIGYPVVVKPPAGAGAEGTHRIEQEKGLEEALAMAAPRPGHELLIEEFVLGDESSLETVSIGGRAVWHSSTRYLPGPLTALENPWIQWCVLLPREQHDPALADIRQVGRQALTALGIDTGLTHMEWFRRRDGSLAVSEVAARPPGAQITTLVSYAHGFDVNAAWARLMIYGRFDPPPRRWATGAAFLRGQGSGRQVKTVRGLGQAQRELGPLVVEAKLPQPGQPRSSSYEGDGFVVVRHPETAVVERALMRLVSLIRVEA